MLNFSLQERFLCINIPKDVSELENLAQIFPHIRCKFSCSNGSKMYEEEEQNVKVIVGSV
jgi:hypothetical protein